MTQTIRYLFAAGVLLWFLGRSVAEGLAGDVEASGSWLAFAVAWLVALTLGGSIGLERGRRAAWPIVRDLAMRNRVLVVDRDRFAARLGIRGDELAPAPRHAAPFETRSAP